MLAFSCSFCHHVNPPGAKFCNECGSPLRLMPCLECDALNEVGSATCHQCGAPLASRAASPKPAANRAPSFDERLEALRRDFGIPRGPPVGTRPVAPANIALASAPSVPIIALADRGLGALRKNDSTPPGSAGSSTTTTSSGIAPASSIAPAAPADHAAASFTATAANAAADHGQPVASPSGPTTIRPAVPAPAEPRTIPPRLLYALGAGLILIGVAGYMYSLYGAPDPIERWLGTLRQALAWQGSAVKAPAESIAPTGDATPSSASRADVAPRSGDAATTAAGTTAPSSTVPTSETAGVGDPNRAIAQTIPGPTTAESPASASAIQTAPATKAAAADASNAPPVAAAPTKHKPRAKRRAGTRKTAPGHSASAPE